MLEWVKTTQLELRSLQQTMQDVSSKSTHDLSVSMQTQTRDIHDRLMQATEVIGELKREAGAFSEVGKSMKELQSLLRSPKMRGNFGEQVLNDLIGQMFPKQSFMIQHRFSTGAIVDIALKTDAGILPIDSKFPMEQFDALLNEETVELRAAAGKAFEKDVKKHVDAISSKYILPAEGTMDFALMYVPSETVYYEIVSRPAILEYARHARVFPVSPTTLYAHLQTIFLSFEGRKLESKSKELLGLLRSLSRDYGKLDTALSTMGKHILNAEQSYTSFKTQFTRFGTSVHTAGEISDEKESVPLIEAE